MTSLTTSRHASFPFQANLLYNQIKSPRKQELMDQFEIYIALIGITILIGVIFRKTTLPIPLLLVITGMLISLIPNLPRVELNPQLILDVFLPMLIYTASAEFSWKDVKANIRPILLLSVGHVLFITIVVALTIHALSPEIGWPMAFVLGAVISPPDDVAILAIADLVRMPYRVVTILKGESMLNDATALILFRFSLVALLTHQFSMLTAVSDFFLVIIGETLYGLLLGHLLGELRLRIQDPILQMMVSILTPFLAYLPPERLGGCGVLATVITGFVIGNRYLDRFSPEVRLIGRSYWTTTAFALQSILFLLVGLNFHYTLEGISSVPIKTLFIYSSSVVAVVLVGRFIWVYPAAYLPRFLFASIGKKRPHLPWQIPFIISWAGMRGGISLAAALAIPLMPIMINGINPRDFIIFLVFSVITATLLIQGLSLPWLIKIIGLGAYSQTEQYHEHLSELEARKKIAKAVLHWLHGYRKSIKNNKALLQKIDLMTQEYQLRKEHLTESLKNHHDSIDHDEKTEEYNRSFLSAQINEVERNELLRLSRENKINHTIRTKLLQQLDHRHKMIG
jgi:CPA1 family monovalent cation:H+ antiporter